MKTLKHLVVLAGFAAVGFFGCSDSSDEASLSFAVTDSSADAGIPGTFKKAVVQYETVVVSLVRIELIGDEDSTESQVIKDYGGDPLSVNLSDLDSLGMLMVDDQKVDPGSYGQLRMIISAPEETMGAPTNPDSYVILTADSTQHPVFVPSGAQTGLKVNLNPRVEIDGGSAYEIILDFNSENSIKKTGGNDRYIIRPTSMTATVTLLDTTDVTSR